MWEFDSIVLLVGMVLVLYATAKIVGWLIEDLVARARWREMDDIESALIEAEKREAAMMAELRQSMAAHPAVYRRKGIFDYDEGKYV